MLGYFSTSIRARTMNDTTKLTTPERTLGAKTIRKVRTSRRARLRAGRSNAVGGGQNISAAPESMASPRSNQRRLDPFAAPRVAQRSADFTLHLMADAV